MHDAGVLFGVELVVLRQQTVLPGVAQAVSLQLRQLLYDLPLTGLAGTERGGVAVSLPIITAVLVEAGVAFLRARRGLRVDTLEVSNDLVHGAVEAVHVQSVEANLRVLATVEPVVVRP